MVEQRYGASEAEIKAYAAGVIVGRRQMANEAVSWFERSFGG